MSFRDLFVKKTNKHVSTRDDSYYGAGETGDDESTSYYGDDSESDQSSSTPKTKVNHGKQTFFGLTWWEILIIIVEIILLTYTVLVFLGLTQIF